MERTWMETMNEAYAWIRGLSEGDLLLLEETYYSKSEMTFEEYFEVVSSLGGRLNWLCWIVDYFIGE